LRPTEGEEETAWKSEVLSRLGPNAHFAVPAPVATQDGGWVRDGWHAMEWRPGHADERRVDEIIRAGNAFHEAVASEPRPAFLDESDDAWSVADRIAWEEESPPENAFLEKLMAEYGEVRTAGQIIHGDLLGNALFADPRPPTLIDWAPYWRPAGLGAAIAVVDAACWHGLPLDELSDDHGIAQWRGLLLRALVFRAGTLHLLGFWNEEGLARHTPVADAIIRLA
jgi:uncharacterized protein (TIGR02569 family)